MPEQTRFIGSPHRRIAYDISGQGPLVLMVPGIGDIRSTYRFLAARLVAAGHSVATVDLRGHGDSDAGWDGYGAAATAGDLAALLDELGRSAVVVGNSMAAGAAVLLAADRPDLVDALVLVGPFVRDVAMPAPARVVLRIALAAPWAARAWQAYLPRLYAGRRPADFDRHVADVVAALRRPGHAAAFAASMRSSHAAVTARLGDVAAPALVVMGELDPDFPDPAAEAAWVADALGGEHVLVAQAGHYPHAQRPEVVAAAMVAFLATVRRDA